MENDKQAHKNFPKKWAWPRSRDPYNFCSTVDYPSDSLASCSLLQQEMYDA